MMKSSLTIYKGDMMKAMILKITMMGFVFFLITACGGSGTGNTEGTGGTGGTGGSGNQAQSADSVSELENLLSGHSFTTVGWSDYDNAVNDYCEGLGLDSSGASAGPPDGSDADVSFHADGTCGTANCFWEALGKDVVKITITGAFPGSLIWGITSVDGDLLYLGLPENPEDYELCDE